MTCRMEVVHSPRGRRRFVRLARRFRSASPHYVAPLTGEVAKLLDPRRNPALRDTRQRLWIALDARGEALGRVAATYNPRHAENLGEPAGWFGFFDAADAETATHLLDTAWAWLQEQGARSMLGPADPDTNHECGCLIQGHEELPYLMMPHHPPDYGRWLERAGLEAAKDLLALETDIETFPLERLEPVVQRILERGRFEIEPVSRRTLPRLLEVARAVYNDAWRENWGFLPMSTEEFSFEAAAMKPILDPDLAKVALQEGRPAGFILALPDVNQALKAIDSRLLPFGLLRLPFLMRRIDRMRTLALGVVKEFRNRGLETALVYQISASAIDKGIRRCEMSWVLENNHAMTSLARSFGGRVSRRYRIYRRS